MAELDIKILKDKDILSEILKECRQQTIRLKIIENRIDVLLERTRVHSLMLQGYRS